MQKYLHLRCSRTTATAIIITTIALFLLIGCQSLFKSAGLTDDQAAEQIAQLKAALADATTAAVNRVQTGLAEGQDLKTTAIDASRIFIWKMITAASATVGIVLNGLLAKWLGTERKISKAMITGIEKSNHPTAKESIRTAAIAAGIQSKLHKRVQALT